jgi:hypothetical protein
VEQAIRESCGTRETGWKWLHRGRKGSRHQWAAEEMWRREGGGCGAADSSWLCLMMFWIFCVPFLQAWAYSVLQPTKKRQTFLGYA